MPAPSVLSSGGPHMPLEPRMVAAACTLYSRAHVIRERSSLVVLPPSCILLPHKRGSLPLLGPRCVPHSLSIATSSTFRWPLCSQPQSSLGLQHPAPVCFKGHISVWGAQGSSSVCGQVVQVSVWQIFYCALPQGSKVHPPTWLISTLMRVLPECRNLCHKLSPRHAGPILIPFSFVQ